MNNKKNKKYLIIGLGTIFLLTVLRFAVYFMKNGVAGIKPPAVILLAGILLFAFLFAGSICIWVYEDSEAHGENGLLWALIVFAVTPFIGLLVYGIRRKEDKAKCMTCGSQINKMANYCEYCGIKQEKTEEINMLKKKIVNKYMVIGILAAVLMLGCITSFTVLAYSSDSIVDKKEINMGIITMKNEYKLKNEWKLNFKSASDGFRKSAKLKTDDNKQILYADITCGEGNLTLYILQGEIENKIDVSNLEKPLEFPLSEYEAGNIKLVLEINGAKDVSSDITIK